MKKQFLAERARALATVYLTRRDDLVLTVAQRAPSGVRDERFVVRDRESGRHA